MEYNKRYLLMTLMALAAFTSCTFSSGEETTADTIKIGFSQCCEDGWRDIMNQEVRREVSRHPELSLLMRAAKSSNELQVKQIKELISEGVEVLLVSPNESAPLTAVLEEAYSSGIHVVLIDRKIESNLYTAFIGASNYNIGKVAGAFLVNKFPQGGPILTIEIPERISPGSERAAGFREGIRSNPQVLAMTDYWPTNTVTFGPGVLLAQTMAIKVVVVSAISFLLTRRKSSR